MTREVAALDIGSNSVNLLVVDVDAMGPPRPRYDELRVPRLSEGLQASGRLEPVAMERTIAAIREMLAEAVLGDDVPLRAVVTAPGRRAENGGEFVDRVRRELGIDVRVASAEEEAALCRLATRRSFPELESFLMIDVGGASTELVLCERDAVTAEVSVDQGAVRLTEAYLAKSDPPSADAVERARDACRESLGREIASFERSGIEAVLVGGTATTLTSVQLGLAEYDGNLVHRAALTTEEIRAFVRRVTPMSLGEKRRLPSIHPRRAEVILGGALLIETIVDLLRLDHAFISDRGVRWGLMWQLTTEDTEGI